MKVRHRKAALLAVLTPIVLPAVASAQTGTWSIRGAMPIANSEFGAAAIGGRIYTVGGFQHEVEHTLLIYEPARDTWAQGPDLPEGTHHAGVAAAGGRLFAIGGTGTESAVQIYDPETEGWSRGRDLPTARTAPAVVALRGRLHVIGGTDSIFVGRAKGAHEVYDPETDSWEVLAPLPFPSEHVFAGVVRGRIYVIGGRNNLAPMGRTQIYDPDSDSWSQGARVPTPTSGHAVAVYRDKIYVFGGEDIPAGGVLDSLQRYEPATDTWELLERGPEALHGVASATVGDAIYFFGGAPIAGDGTGTTSVFRYAFPPTDLPAPSRLRAKARSATTIRLRWRDNSDGETAFVVQMRREGKRRFRKVATLSADVRRLVVSGLDPDTEYAFRVRALEGPKKSDYSNEATARTRP